MSVAEHLESLDATWAPGPVLVHSNVLTTSRFVEPSRSRRTLLEHHVERVMSIAAGRPCWFPAFNYDFLGSGVYDVARDRSQVGALSEHVRKNSSWRSRMPVFNVCGTGSAAAPSANPTGEVDPVGSSSAFDDLIRQDGSVLWYGAPFRTATIIHHAETLAGGPAYRYDKLFPGCVVDEGVSSNVVLRYHVRPLGRTLDYDWGQLAASAFADGALRSLDAHGVILVANARQLAESWVERLERNPMDLLDNASRRWVGPELERLGRRFQIGDFE